MDIHPTLEGHIGMKTVDLAPAVFSRVGIPDLTWRLGLGVRARG